MYKNKKTEMIGSIIILAFIAVLVFTTNMGINNFSKIENIINKLVMPIQNGIVQLKNKIAKNDSYFETVDNLKAKIEELTKQKEELTQKLNEVQIIKSENRILREYANLSERYSEYNIVTAYVINKSISNLSEIFVINVGTDDGVYANMAVMGKDGLIGHTISATRHTAKVQPIIDSSSSISGVTSDTRNNVIIRGKLGSKNELIVSSVQPDTELFIGDTIETSGLGGIYPKGIKIGTIKELVQGKNATEKYAILESSIDYEKLEYVLVIKNNGL